MKLINPMIEIQPVECKFSNEYDYNSRLLFYCKMLKKNPKCIYYRKQRSKLYLFFLKDYNSALKDINFILSSNEYNFDTFLFYRSICLFNLGKYDLALKDIEKFSNESSQMNNFRYIGLVYETCGEFNKAVKTYSRFTKKNPENYLGYFLRGCALANVSNSNRNLKLAIEDFIIANTLESSNPEILKQLGLAYLDNDEIDKAIYTFENAITHFDISKCESIIFELGKIYQRLGKRDKAISNFRKIAHLEQEDPEYNLSMGQLYYELGNFEIAISHFQETIKANPNNCTAYSSLATVFMKKNEYLNAINTYSEIIKICPHCINARNQVSIKIFSAYLDLDDEENALKTIESALDEFPNSEYLQSFVLGCKKMLFRLNIEVIRKVNNPFFQAAAKIRDHLHDSVSFQNFFETIRTFWYSLKVENIDKKYLFQYTSQDVLESILNSGKLWLTPVEYLNDPIEGLSLLEILQGSKPDQLDNTITQNILDKAFDQESKLTVFVRSLTSLEDSMQMWNSSYAQNGKGVSIGINSSSIAQASGFNGFSQLSINSFCNDNNVATPSGLYKIHYIEPNDINLINIGNSFYELILQHQTELATIQDLAEAIFLLFSTIRYLIKKGCYSHENEFRLVYFSMLDKNDPKIIQNFKTGLHVETDKLLCKNDSQGKIIIGPKIENTRYNQIKHIIQFAYPTLQVIKSTIPFR
ncbi:Lipopolysaccharide assembly protein B [bioreactor metagenome]|uniref:Lipopolysaccharide assembly protein B n=1 Tax=bioreactor metagenome TaxID=1076179 RepID=A0A644WZA6_9ZZZZ